MGFSEMEKRVAQAFEKLGQPDHLKGIENQVIKHNHAIEIQINLLNSEIDQLSQSLSKIKDRQDQFLDSLILPNLTTVDRKRINSKLEELDIEAKQFQITINKKEFESNQKSQELFSLIDIKQAISECISLDTADLDTYRSSLKRLINTITVYPTKLTFQFRWIPWPWEIDI
jgi:chromosome segregation ATPase